ncbi:MAG: non-reducing end alpha-L-arabinofuranosidase family hydrolase [Planctomycetota bacterium]
MRKAAADPIESLRAPGAAADPVAFAWTTGRPFVRTAEYGQEDWIALKDPSIVRHEGRWHMFCTVRGHERSHAVAYLSFEEFGQAQGVEPVIMPMHEGYVAAPQVFYFEPQKKWYMICQAINKQWTPGFRGAYSTTDDPSDPASWTPLRPLDIVRPEKIDKPYLDYWVICDDERAFVFFSSNNGKLWRTETALADFPNGWSFPEVAREGRIFEASHIYKLADRPGYFMVMEAIGQRGRRFFRGFTADRLDGDWSPIGRDGIYASVTRPEKNNVAQPGGRWTDSISHGELLRTGVDQRMEVELHAPFVFQGVADDERRGRDYGKIPWSLGLLSPVHEAEAEAEPKPEPANP